MAVYVDSLLPYPKNRCWPYHEACHLVADTSDELHIFAAKIGLRERWFQNHPRLPHYDLTKSKRVLAVQCGAQEIDRKTLVSMMCLPRVVRRYAEWTKRSGSDMDPKTGKIREFESNKAAADVGFTLKIGCRPNPGCRKCYGRGYVSQDVRGKIPCSCVKPRKD